MTQMTIESDEFANYLHDPFNEKWQTDLEKKVIEITKNKPNYDIKEHLILLLKDFKNSKNLHKNGLSYYFNLLKDVVVEKKIIGVILFGTNFDPDIVLTKYLTINNDIITISIKSVCKCLIKDYLRHEYDLDELCKLAIQD